jgi:hypothetical protein
MSQNKLKEQSS